MGAARRQIIAGALRRGAGQHGRFDLYEALRVQKGAQGLNDAGAQAQIALHERAAQIHIAILQPDVVMHLLVIQLKGRRFGLVQDLDRVPEHLHLAGWPVGVGRALGPKPEPAADPDHVFIAHRIGDLEGFRPVRVKHDLGDALAIAQIDEDHAAMIPAPMYPAAQPDFLIDMSAVEFPAIMTAHEWLPVA